MRAAICFALCLCAPAAAIAADNGFYLGGSVGQTTTDFPGELSDLIDDEDQGYKIVAGYRLLDWFGVEASYVDLGEVTQRVDFPDLSDFRLEQKGVDAFAVLFAELATFDLFAKAGLVQWDAEASFSSIFGNVSASEDGTDFAWGVGAQARLGSFAVRAEYERFEIDETDGLIGKPQLLSLGFTWTFL
jgi:hypothetical protein